MFKNVQEASPNARHIITLFADIEELGDLIIMLGSNHMMIPLQHMVIGQVIHTRIIMDGWACDIRKNTFNDGCILTAFTDRRY